MLLSFKSCNSRQLHLCISPALAMWTTWWYSVPFRKGHSGHELCGQQEVFPRPGRKRGTEIGLPSDIATSRYCVCELNWLFPRGLHSTHGKHQPGQPPEDGCEEGHTRACRNSGGSRGRQDSPTFQGERFCSSSSIFFRRAFEGWTKGGRERKRRMMREERECREMVHKGADRRIKVDDMSCPSFRGNALISCSLTIS